MKSELNDYKITNSDGIIKYDNEGKKRFDNDNPHYIKENSLSSQDENFREIESFGLEKDENNDKVKNQKTSNNVSKTTSQTSTASTSTATSTVASSTSAISGSIGSLVGGVVSSIATVVIVVAAFVSIMTINISLVMASANSLVFQIEITNAQKEDFENPVYAILKGDGYLQTQEISMDSVYLTFEDLEAGKEYVITIKNDEKVFAEKSYITATNDIQRGFIEAWNEEGTVYALVNVRELKSDEFYTFTATSSSGKVLFKDSDIRPEKEYSFDIESPDTLTFTLSINGKICCFEQLTIYPEPEYDFTQGTWSWSNDYLTAYISFPENNGGEPLTYEAFVQEYETPATCEQMGSIVYTASVYVEEADEMFSDEQTVELTPTGHDYGEPVFEWSQGVTGAPTATATFTCSNDSSHQMVLTADVSESYAQDQTLQYIATVTYNNVTYEDIYEVDPIIEGVEIDLNEGQLYINASGYARQESGLSNPTEFISSEANPYLIQNQNINWCDNIINVYQTDSSIQTADIYIKLKNVTIEVGSWCSLFRIMAKNTLNIYLIIEGNVTFVGGSGQQIFSSQGSNSPTVNIIIDQTSFGGTFNAEISDGLTYAQSGTINVRYV